MDLKDNPFWCPKHGFTEVITAEGVGSVPKIHCPFCRAEEAEAINDFTKKTLADAGFQHLPEALKELKTQADRVKKLEAEVERLSDELKYTSDDRAHFKAEMERLVNLLDKIKLEAQCHAQEARTQRSTVQRVIQAGKPGMGDWEDVPGMVGALKAQMEAVQEVLAEKRLFADNSYIQGLNMGGVGGPCCGAKFKIDTGRFMMKDLEAHRQMVRLDQAHRTAMTLINNIHKAFATPTPGEGE